MAKKIYSAGIVSKGFWFLEFKKYMELLSEGKTAADIKEIQLKNNIFATPSKEYGIKILGEMNRRSEALPLTIRELFYNVDLDTQKLINLIGIILNDKLLGEYIYTSYRKNIMMGIDEYDNSSTRNFLADKAAISEDVEKFSDVTKKRMVGAYRTYLYEAGLLEEVEGKTKYKKIFLNYNLEKELIANNREVYVKALKGES